MPLHLKQFERFYYGAVVLGLGLAFLERPGAAEIVVTVIFALILIALIWAAARKGQVWCAWILVVLTVLGIVQLIVSLAGGATPRWLSWLRPETPQTTLQNVIEVVATLMEVAGLYFYFLGGKRT